LHGKQLRLLGNDQGGPAQRLLRQGRLQILRHFLPFGQLLV
jgi:hypothetical protein